jgi:hypothetical protein
MNYLHRLSVEDGKRGAKNFMSLDHDVESLFQRSNVEWAGETHSDRNVVVDPARLQLIEKPQSLLGKRERQRVIATHALYWRNYAAGANDLLDPAGQFGDCRRFKQRPQRKLYG